MKDTILFALPGNETITGQLASHLKAEVGEIITRKFPDGETYVQFVSVVSRKKVVLVCTLDQPDKKIIALYFLAKTASDLGAESVCLIAPYLPYMRQDKSFNQGEGVTSRHFGELVSSIADTFVTVDPHLHRIKSLSEVINGKYAVVHSAEQIAQWITKNLQRPMIIGPDEESVQWVSKVAKKANAPFIALNKTRLSDEEVEISVPDHNEYKDRTLVLMDDIISTGETMLEVISKLKSMSHNKPVCIGIHAVFSGDAYNKMIQSGVADIVTCNTIPHKSNKIDISRVLSEGYRELYR